MNVRTRGRAGWSKEETDMLFNEARRAVAENRPMKSVFSAVAASTGRMPNSIRNYYYLELKNQDGLHKSGFMPFMHDQVDLLLEDMLTSQARGRSVRSIAMELAGGDKKQMLRYQNKYRSVLRSNPDLIDSAIKRLSERGEEYVNPFDHKRVRKDKNVSALIKEIYASLAELEKNIEKAE